jgi:hypothetical protein
MDHFALLPSAERATIFREAAARLKLGAATIVEKDFWVSWTLQRISGRLVQQLLRRSPMEYSSLAPP